MSVRDSRYYKRQIEWMRKQTQAKHADDPEDDLSTSEKRQIQNQSRLNAWTQKKNKRLWTERMKRMITDYTDFRQFDPLKPLGKRNGSAINPTCILHIAGHVESKNRGDKHQYVDSGGAVEDFLCLKRSVESLKEQTISAAAGFQLELLVSINGYVTDPGFIGWFKSINDTWLNNKIYCKVFQRPNFGYHWAGLHDVWMRYKETNCQWYASLECDHVFMVDAWFDQVTKVMKHTPKIGLFGKYQRETTVEPGFPIGVQVPANTWRNGNGTVKEKPNSGDLIHTCGAFCMLKREVLEKMDAAFGCFTFAMGINHTVDGCIYGEIGICQKVTALGYSIKGKPIEFLVRPMRGADRFPKLWNKLTEEKEKWSKK